MSGSFWLTELQMERFKPFFPLSHGKPRGDDRRVLNGIDLHQSQRVALTGRARGPWPAEDALQSLGPVEPVGFFGRILRELGAEGRERETLMSDGHPPQGAPDGLQPAGHIGGLPR